MAVNRCRAGTASVDGRPARARLAAIALFVVSFGVGSVVQPIPAWAVSSNAQQLLDLINQERVAIGAQPLAFRDDLVQIASDHSAWMASPEGEFKHRASLSAGVTGSWTRIGENIAYGPVAWGVSSIHEGFMASNGHCINNLFVGFNRVGIEFATSSDNYLYVTVVFVQESGSNEYPTVCPTATTTTTAPPPTTTAPPPASTTTTTAPPPTTTAPPATSTTTTTAPPATSTTTTTAPPPTTTAPPTTTTTGATEVVLPLSASTTTSVSAPPTPSPGRPSIGEEDASASAPAGSSESHQDTGSLPVLPLAGGTALLTAAGAWWLIATKRAATRVAGPATWGIPHGGIRPPQ